MKKILKKTNKNLEKKSQKSQKYSENLSRFRSLSLFLELFAPRDKHIRHNLTVSSESLVAAVRKVITLSSPYVCLYARQQPRADDDAVTQMPV